MGNVGLDSQKGWRALQTALITAYKPSSAPVDKQCIIQAFQAHGICLPDQEILDAISLRLTRLPFDMPLDYIPDRPLAAIPRGTDLISLTEDRIRDFAEWAARGGTGWDPDEVWNWVDRQYERLNERAMRLAAENDLAEVDDEKEICDVSVNSLMDDYLSVWPPQKIAITSRS
ncbi:hypothetical protein [Roseinatronobacter monicus]|uniref:hypothetical protein n=1 Tax=Roseinatronobacter monicus TaxID=393481 RepID=UPI0011547BFA|nr:hypothetical protein [Roseinatronobacter monicus]